MERKFINKFFSSSKFSKDDIWRKKKSVIYYENIKIGNRIRDIIQSPDRRIVLLTDTIMREKDSELIFLAK